MLTVAACAKGWRDFCKGLKGVGEAQQTCKQGAAKLQGELVLRNSHHPTNLGPRRFALVWH